MFYNLIKFYSGSNFCYHLFVFFVLRGNIVNNPCKHVRITYRYEKFEYMTAVLCYFEKDISQRQLIRTEYINFEDIRFL